MQKNNSAGAKYLRALNHTEPKRREWTAAKRAIFAEALDMLSQGVKLEKVESWIRSFNKTAEVKGGR